MKKRRARKKKKKAKRSRRKQHNSKSSKFKTRVRLNVEGLEVAKGFDGLFRGAPEPVLVCGLFALLENERVLIGRGIGRFSKPRTFPTTVVVSDHTLIDARRPAPDPPHLVVVIIALEEDGGEDIQRAYAMFQSHSEMLFLETSDVPIAADVRELLVEPDHWRHPRDIDLVVDGSQFSTACHSDKWIAATVFTTEIGIPHRAHFISSDKRNDWTAIVSLR